jgi:hypothetical protein
VQRDLPRRAKTRTAACTHRFHRRRSAQSIRLQSAAWVAPISWGRDLEPKLGPHPTLDPKRRGEDRVVLSRGVQRRSNRRPIEECRPVRRRGLPVVETPSSPSAVTPATAREAAAHVRFRRTSTWRRKRRAKTTSIITWSSCSRMARRRTCGNRARACRVREELGRIANSAVANGRERRRYVGRSHWSEASRSTHCSCAFAKHCCARGLTSG